MKRYIYNIQYNETDNNKLFDKIWIDGVSFNDVIRKLKKLFPGAFKFHLVKIEPNYPYFY